MKKIIYIFLLAILFSCSGSKNGYESIDDVFTAFADAINSSGNLEMEEFTQNLFPDKPTIEFMLEHKIYYRGLTPSIDINTIEFDKALSKAKRDLLDVKSRFNNGIEKELIYNSNNQNYKTDKHKEMEFFEGNIVFETENKEISYLLGELIKVNNKWVMFTRPSKDFRAK